MERMVAPTDPSTPVEMRHADAQRFVPLPRIAVRIFGSQMKLLLMAMRSE
jgi:hypothetical protein